MNEHDLIDALDERVTDVPVGAAPIDTMMRSARGARRRRGLGAGLAAAVVVAGVALGTTALVGDGSGGGDSVDVASDVPAWQTPPDGMRYVGLGHAAIAVPEQWPDNATNCGTPEQSTVIIDVGVTCLALYPYPAETDSVEVRPAYEGEDFSTWTPVEVGGVDAQRLDDEPMPGLDGGAAVSGASLYLPEEGVVFRAQSSISPDRVDSLLSGVAVFEDAVAVPGFQAVTAESQEGAAAAYLAVLREAGLTGEQVDQLDKRKYPSGWVISTDPAPGTLVAPGSTVRVTVAR